MSTVLRWRVLTLNLPQLLFYAPKIRKNLTRNAKQSTAEPERSCMRVEKAKYWGDPVIEKDPFRSYLITKWVRVSSGTAGQAK